MYLSLSLKDKHFSACYLPDLLLDFYSTWWKHLRSSKTIFWTGSEWHPDCWSTLRSLWHWAIWFKVCKILSWHQTWLWVTADIVSSHSANFKSCGAFNLLTSRSTLRRWFLRKYGKSASTFTPVVQKGFGKCYGRYMAIMFQGII